MTRLPELERQLFLAAKSRARRRRRWMVGLLGGGATFAIVGAAGAVSLFLPEGDPVPRAQDGLLVNLPGMDPGSTRVVSVRAADPEGGLPWGIAVTRGRIESGQLYCAQVGRVQDERLGVIGRDQAFGNDGRFHPLSIGANQSGTCGGAPTGGDFRMNTDEPPIPASGYTGDVLGGAGGCRERASRRTLSPKLWKQLKDIPQCSKDSLRLVKYGFAGRDAVKVRFGGQTLRPNPQEFGAYLFVLRPPAKRPTLVVTYKDGTVCRFKSGVGTPCP